MPPDDTEQPVSDECEIPLVVFQGVDASSEKKDDECSDDCESFIPTDLMTMAWQIAKGMVGRACFVRKFGNHATLTAYKHIDAQIALNKLPFSNIIVLY